MAVAVPLQNKALEKTIIAEKACNSTAQRKGNGEMMNKAKESLPKNENPLQQNKSTQNPLQTAPPANNPLQLQSRQISAPSQVIQRVEREATVVWEITHLVEEQDESLFGGADALANELPVNKGGQLTKGQQLLLDDEPVMLSRRGANQENAEKRAVDKKGPHTYKWIRVLGIINGEGRKIDLSKNKVYVREETIKFTSQAPDKSKARQKDIEVVKVENWEKEEMDTALQEISEEWIKLGERKRRRSIGLDERNNKEKDTNELCSCPNWDQFDEGPDVADDMRDKDYRKDYDATKKLWIYKAVYKGEKEPIAVMILEKRKNEVQKEGPDMLYVRWLVGHPAKGGGGSELIEKAKTILVEEKLTIIRLESAHSAAGWYKGKGKDFIDKGPADHQDTGKGCGCREMEFTRKDT